MWEGVWSRFKHEAVLVAYAETTPFAKCAFLLRLLTFVFEICNFSSSIIVFARVLWFDSYTFTSSNVVDIRSAIKKKTCKYKQDNQGLHMLSFYMTLKERQRGAQLKRAVLSFLSFCSLLKTYEVYHIAYLCPSVSNSSMGAFMTFFFSVACSSIIRRAPSRSWGKSFLDTVSCISSRRVSIWVAWPENSSNATRTWNGKRLINRMERLNSSLSLCVHFFLLLSC